MNKTNVFILLSTTIFLIIANAADYCTVAVAANGDPSIPALATDLKHDQYLVASSDTTQENIFWQSIKDSKSPEYFAAYLNKYPNGVYAAIAEIKLKELPNKGNGKNQEFQPDTSKTTKRNNSQILSLEQAKAEGIPSPPYNKIIIGKRWVEKITNKTSGNILYHENEIISDDKSSYTMTIKILNEDKKLINNIKDTVNKDGTLFIDPSRKSRIKTTGYMWPSGKLQKGDSWTYVYTYVYNYTDGNGSFILNQKTSTAVLGFEHFNGYDCIVLKMATTEEGTLPAANLMKVYFAYNEGVVIYSKKFATDKLLGKYSTIRELVDLKYQ